MYPAQSSIRLLDAHQHLQAASQHLALALACAERAAAKKAMPKALVQQGALRPVTAILPRRRTTVTPSAAAPLNPAAPSFVPNAVSTSRQDAMAFRPTIRPTFSHLLHQGESIYVSVGCGRYADRYPKRRTAVTIYDGKGLLVTACEDVPHLVGTYTTDPAQILHLFVRGLLNAGMRLNDPPASHTVWRNLYVKRENTHRSFQRLYQEWQHASPTH